MSATIRAAVAAMMLVGLAAQGAEPGALQAQVPVPQRQFTLDDIDGALERLRRMVWNAPPSMQRLVDSQGHSFEQDMSQFAFTDESLGRIAATREKIASEYPSGVPIPQETYATIARQVLSEYCRITAVEDQWRIVDAGNRHRELVSALIRQLPQGERDAANARLERVHEQVEASREQLLPILQKCDAQERAMRGPTSAIAAALFREYNTLRATLAERVDLANQSKGIYPPVIARSTPCPAPAMPVAGSSRPKVVKQGDPFKHFPPSALYSDLTGTVRVRINYDAGGCITGASVLGSSGSEELDMAAVTVAFETELIPSEQEAKAGGGAVVQPVTFSILDWTSRAAASVSGQPQP